MPRKQRRVPRGMNQFRYWHYSVSHPAWGDRLPTEQSIEEEAHLQCAMIFQEIREGSEENKPGRQKVLRPYFGNLVDDPGVYPLCWYIYSDPLWQQDEDAYDLFRKLPERIRTELWAVDQKKWGHKGKWTWKILLREIAKDQRIFREILILTPTECGLVEGTWKRAKRVDPVWQRHGISRSRARRIYELYHQKLSELLGLGVNPPAGWREWMKQAGYLGPDGRIPTAPLMEFLSQKSKEERKTFSDVVVHWFAHALRNLREYRNNRRPIPWTPFDCMKECLDVQQRLCR